MLLCFSLEINIALSSVPAEIVPASTRLDLAGAPGLAYIFDVVNLFERVVAFEFNHRIVPFDPADMRRILEKSEIIDRARSSKLKYILAKINTCQNFLNGNALKRVDRRYI